MAIRCGTLKSWFILMTILLISLIALKLNNILWMQQQLFPSEDSSLRWNERHVRRHTVPPSDLENAQPVASFDKPASQRLQGDANSYSTGSHQKMVHLTIPHAGSTTFQNVLLSNAYLRGKSVIVSSKKNSHFVDTRDLEPDTSWTILPEKESSPHLMVEQAVYRETFFNKYFANNTVYIASLRDPRSWFSSYTEHLNKKEMESKFTPKDFLQNSSLFHGPADPQMTWVVHNPFLHWLGFTSPPDDKYHEKLVLRHIKMIDRKFDLVMLAEYTMESLVLLKRYMHWSMADIFHSPESVRYFKRIRINIFKPEEEDMLVNAQHNRGDWLLYQHFNKTFWSRISREKDFSEELETFTTLNEQVSNFCGNGIDVKKVLHLYTQLEPDITIDGQRCFSLKNQWKDIFSIK